MIPDSTQSVDCLVLVPGEKPDGVWKVLTARPRVTSLAVEEICVEEMLCAHSGAIVLHVDEEVSERPAE